MPRRLGKPTEVDLGGAEELKDSLKRGGFQLSEENALSGEEPPKWGDPIDQEELVDKDTLEHHTKAPEIDHPEGSINTRHMEPSLRALLESMVQGDNEARLTESMTIEKVLTVLGGVIADLTGDVTGDLTGDVVNMAGFFFEFGGTVAPTGFLECDGASYLRATYPRLFAAIGTTWGSVDGTHFNVPDGRGATLRGTGSHGSETMADGNPFAGPAVGAFEDDQMQGHTHQIEFYSSNPAVVTGVQTVSASLVRSNPIDMSGGLGINNTPISDSTNGTPRAGDETRSFAAGVLICIKT